MDLHLLIFSDFNYGILPQSLVSKIIIECNKRNLKIVADSQSSSQIGDISKFKDVDFLMNFSIDGGLDYLTINSGLIIYELSKIDAPEEEVFKEFLYEFFFWWIQFSSE